MSGNNVKNVSDFNRIKVVVCFPCETIDLYYYAWKIYKKTLTGGIPVNVFLSIMISYLLLFSLH